MCSLERLPIWGTCISINSFPKMSISTVQNNCTISPLGPQLFFLNENQFAHSFSCTRTKGTKPSSE